MKLISRILQEERRLKSRTTESETALMMKERKDQIVCFNCNKQGHFKSECRSAPSQNASSSDNRPSRNRRGKQQQRANVADGDGSTDNTKAEATPQSTFGTVWMAENAKEKDVDEQAMVAADPDGRYMDSGATIHICPYHRMHH